MAETPDSLMSLTFQIYFLMRTMITGAGLYEMHWLCNLRNRSVHYPSLGVESYVTEGKAILIVYLWLNLCLSLRSSEGHAPLELSCPAPRLSGPSTSARGPVWCSL